MEDKLEDNPVVESESQKTPPSDPPKDNNIISVSFANAEPQTLTPSDLEYLLAEYKQLAAVVANMENSPFVICK